MRRSVAAILMLAACFPAAAQSPAPDAAKDYPNRAIHIVVPFPAAVLPMSQLGFWRSA